MSCTRARGKWWTLKNIQVWEIRTVCRRCRHPASRTVRLSALAVPIALPVPPTLQQANSSEKLLGHPHPSPGRCRLCFTFLEQPEQGRWAWYPPRDPLHPGSVSGDAFCSLWTGAQSGPGPMGRNMLLLPCLEPLEGSTCLSQSSLWSSPASPSLQATRARWRAVNFCLAVLQRCTEEINLCSLLFIGIA